MARDKRIKEIQVRGKRRYRAKIDTGTNSSRHQQSRTFDSVKDAEKWIAESTLGRHDGSLIRRSELTLTQACEDWVEHKRSLGELRPKTLRDYASAMTCFTRSLGHRPVQTITVRDIEGIVESLVALGRVKRTIDYNTGVMSQVFDRLVRHKKIPENPVAALSIRRAGKPSPPPSTYTTAELATIRNHVYRSDHALAHAFMLSLHGLRRSEVLGLRFEDFSQEGWVTIARSRPPSSRKQITTEDTKSKASRRTIKIDEETLSAIMRDSARRGTQEGFVAVDEAGRPISSDRYTDLWRSLVAETGLPVHNFLVLRRSVETAMRDSGVPIHISAAVMGHSELMSMKHYTAAHQERIDTAHESMNALLDRSV